MINSFTKVSRFLSAIGGVVLFIISFAIVIDVLFRNLDMPITGSLEIVEIAFVGACFLGFAFTHLTDREIRVDITRMKLRGRWLALTELISALVTAVLFGLLTWYAIDRAIQAYRIGDFLEGRLLLPSVIPWSFISIGSALTFLCCSFSSCHHLGILLFGDLMSSDNSD